MHLKDIKAGQTFRIVGSSVEYKATHNAQPAKARGYVVVLTDGEGWSQYAGRANTEVELVNG